MPIPTPAKPSVAADRRDVAYAPGQIIGGKYRLKALIGEGGMGEVWLAQNTTLHVDVAIKLIRAEIAGSDEAAQRLLNEARAAAQIDHPSIVQVHDFGSTERDDPFIVMELLRGCSLEDLIQREAPFEPTYAVALLLPILGALQAAHPKGIVHRDLKPDNIFLCQVEEGGMTPKIVDFGIAKVKYRTIETDISAELRLAQRAASNMTQMGELLGSPQFMSPEQVRSDRDIDGRADLWSIAIVLYQMLSGAAPFPYQSDDELLLAILAEDPVPVPHLDEQLWTVLAKGLAKKRDDRWRSAREMGTALATWLASQGVDVDVTGRGLRGWLGASMAPPPRGSVAPTTLPPPSMTPSAVKQQRAVPWVIGVAVLGIGGAATYAVIGGAEEPIPQYAPSKTTEPTATAVPSEPRTPTSSAAPTPATPETATAPPTSKPKARPRARPVAPRAPAAPKPDSDDNPPIPNEVLF